VKIKVVEIVPHQGDLHVAGRGTFTLKTSAKFRCRAFSSGTSLHFGLRAGGLDLGLALRFDLCKFGLPSGFPHLGQARLFFLAGSAKTGFLFGLPLEAFFFRPPCFGFFHPATGVFLLPARLFFTLQACCASRPLTGIVGFEAAPLTLDFRELPVKLRARRGEVGTGHARTEALGDHALAQVNPRIAAEHQTEHAEAEGATKGAGEGDAQRVHAARQNKVGLDRIAQTYRLGTSKD
jgi:hypothetical protein